MAQIGYTSVKTAGLRRDGEITEPDLTEIVRRNRTAQAAAKN